MSSPGERLREERQRLKLSQTEFGERGGVLKQAQIKYEKGERSPDTEYLAAIAAAGADVRYIVTGERGGIPPLLPEERLLLDRFRASPQPLRDAALRVLLGGEPTPPAGSQRFVFHGEVAGGVHNVEGDYTQNGPTTINQGRSKKK